MMRSSAPGGASLAGAGGPAAKSRQDAAELLLELDAALTRDANTFASDQPAPDRQTPGLSAAVALNEFLARQDLAWADVVALSSFFSKLCGRLGSDYAGEREAAYAHAVRFITRHHTTWSGLVHLPPGVNHTTASAASVAPPEGNWIATVEVLKTRSAWRSGTEQAVLNRLENDLARGQDIPLEDALLLRDMWWCAELNDPVSDEDFW